MSAQKTTPRLPRSVPVGQMRRNLEAVQRFRMNFVFGALLVLFLVLLGRLGKLQLVDAATWRHAAAHGHDARVTFRGLRGRLLDRRGRVLASSRRVLSVAVDPSLLGDPEAFARRLALVLDDDDGGRSIAAAIRSAPAGCRHRPLRYEIEDERVVSVLLGLTTFTETLAADLKGLKVSVGERRTYPNGDYAIDVLGLAPSAERGRAGGGLERSLDAALRGGRMTVPVAHSGGTSPTFRSALAVDPLLVEGRDVRLTLDVVVQHYVESALDELQSRWSPRAATAIVLVPGSGEVLAMANRHAGASGRGFDVAVTGTWPPGSIFKPLVAARALGLGVVGRDERIDLPAEKRFEWHGASRLVHDVHANGEDDGAGTVVRIIGHSSNVGVSELLWRLMALRPDGTPAADRDPAAAFALFEDLGFSGPTGIELSRSEPVTVDTSSRNPLFPTLGFAFGQGFAISPLRLLSIFAALARDDARVVRPTLLPGHGGGRRDLPPVCRRPQDLALVRQGLADTVEDGTAHEAFEGADIEVAGKTGTAEIQRTTWQIAGFAGFAPRDRPRLAVLVMAQVDREAPDPVTGVKPYGGSVAAPAARQILERSLAYLDGRALDEGAAPGLEEGR